MNEVYVFKVQGLTWLGDVRHRACSTQHVFLETGIIDSDEDTLIMLTMIMLFVVIV